MLGRTGPGALEVTLTDTNVIFSNERTITVTTPNFTIGSITNQTAPWTHLALTFDKAASQVRLLVNGRVVAERSVPMVYYSSPIYGYRLFSPATTGNLYLGWRPSGSYSGSRFRGAMDEVSVYYRALTPLELQAIYVVGANGKCSPAPTCQAFHPSIVSWWRGESNVLDSVDGNHGFVSPAGGPLVTYTNGIVGSGFRTTSSRYVQIPASPSLNVGAGAGLTFETWFKLDVANSTFALASWNLGATQGVFIGTSPTRGPNYFEANLVDTAGVSHSILFNNSPYTNPRTPPWQHLAVTYDKPSGQTILYLNGSPVVVTNLGSFTPRTTGALNLGYRPQSSFGGATLNGALDETALYNRALTPGEITANYRNVANRCMTPPVIVTPPANVRVNIGSNVLFQVVAEGSPVLRYEWGMGSPSPQGRGIPGATNSTLIVTNARISGTYWVRVTNAFGFAVSSNIMLTVNQPPIALDQVVITTEDTARGFNLLASDPNLDSLAFIIVAEPTNGTLTVTSSNLVYTPAPNYHGLDRIVFKASDGLLESAPATVSITVTPVNDAPEAVSQILATDEDVPLAFTLGATDVDGDALTFNIAPPAHGTLSGTAPDLVYTPHANFFGEDVFTFTAHDGHGGNSALAAVSITVRSVNDAPVPRIEITPLNELPGVTNIVTIAPVCCAATLRLDGSLSADAEQDPLTLAWFAGTNFLGADAVLTNRFLPGTHEITLVVSDGTVTTNTTVTVEIITAVEAVQFLHDLTAEGIAEQRLRGPLLVWLRLAEESFEHCRVELGVGFLELYVRRIEDRLMAHDRELATNLVNTAEAIIEAAPDCDPCQRLGRRHRRHENRREDRDRNPLNDNRSGRASNSPPAAESLSAEAELRPVPAPVRDSRPGATIERSSPELR
jgi:hypothetical protein